MKPLEGLVVLDFSQFLAGPVAALRLADLGARVSKVELPEVEDLCQRVSRRNNASLETSRCRIRTDGQILVSRIGAPRIGQHTQQILEEMKRV